MNVEEVTLEHQVGALLRRSRITISVAESCTGGLISHRMTNIPGSSDYYERGVVCYSNKSKIDILHVSPETLKKFGAVSSQTATEMARGIKEVSGTDFGLAVTGIAGPSGGTPKKPVGTVFICLVSNKKVTCKEFGFKGNRERIKHQTSEAALGMIKEQLCKESEGQNPRTSSV